MNKLLKTITLFALVILVGAGAKPVDQNKKVLAWMSGKTTMTTEQW